MVTRGVSAPIENQPLRPPTGEFGRRLGEQRHPDLEAVLVDIERRRVVAGRMVGPDEDVRRHPAVFLDALHQVGHVLADAELLGRHHALDALDLPGDVAHGSRRWGGCRRRGTR